MKIIICTASAFSLFIVIIPYFFIPISNANPSADDKAFIAFMKGYPNVQQISEYSKQKYEAHLGILYFMRKNWQCDKIATEFEEYERTECQKYRKYLNILYEYLCREYVGIPTVNPKFVFKRQQIEINGPIIYAVNCLAHISLFNHDHNLNILFNSNLFFFVFQPNLLNEERLNYAFELENESKMPINEMILQLAIDTANECQTNEKVNGIIRENFNKNLEEMLKKAEESEKEEQEEEDNDGDDDDDDQINDDKHWIIMSFYFDSSCWIEDFLFSEFVKGLATNFTNFPKLTKKYPNREKVNPIHEYEAHLGIVYLMKKHWQCDKTEKELEENERTECQKYRKYLNIFYEYLFGLYVEAKSPEIKKQLPSLVKPNFLLTSLFGAVKKLDDISKYFWKKGENELLDFNTFSGINLVNEKELNYEINGEKSEENGEKVMIKNEKKFNDSQVDIANLRKEFERELEKICEKTKENAREEKANLVKALTNTANNGEKLYLERQYDGKFGTFNSSPFS